ncbi:hypothetical protein [Jatrophihabitans fulvus]
MSDHENSQAEEPVDDVAGHGKTMPKISEDTDDVAGHGKTMPKISDDDADDDVAGHGKTMPKISDDTDGPGFVSGALSSDDSLPSARAK